jgi:hypothetical protein
MVNTRVWSFIKAPWEDEMRPRLEATFVLEGTSLSRAALMPVPV